MTEISELRGKNEPGSICQTELMMLETENLRFSLLKCPNVFLFRCFGITNYNLMRQFLFLCYITTRTAHMNLIFHFVLQSRRLSHSKHTLVSARLSLYILPVCWLNRYCHPKSCHPGIPCVCFMDQSPAPATTSKEWATQKADVVDSILQTVLFSTKMFPLLLPNLHWTMWAGLSRTDFRRGKMVDEGERGRETEMDDGKRQQSTEQRGQA